MLIKQENEEIQIKCLKIIKEQFNHEKEMSLSYFDDKLLLTNEDCTYLTILGIVDIERIHCFYTVLKKELRGQGLGRQYLKEQLEYCKINYPNYRITRQVRKTNWINLGLLIKEGFKIYNDEGKFYQLIMN